MRIKSVKSVWLTTSILGCVYGTLISIQAWLGLFTNIELHNWLFLSNILFISLLIVLASLGLVFSHRGVPFVILTLAVFLCAIIWSGIFMTTYIISTTFFVDQAVQIAFFKRDYIYHGYKSVAEALSANNNAMELIKLQIFSLALSATIQWGALIIGISLNKVANIKVQKQRIF